MLSYNKTYLLQNNVVANSFADVTITHDRITVITPWGDRSTSVDHTSDNQNDITDQNVAQQLAQQAMNDNGYSDYQPTNVWRSSTSTSTDSAGDYTYNYTYTLLGMEKNLRYDHISRNIIAKFPSGYEYTAYDVYNPNATGTITGNFGRSEYGNILVSDYIPITNNGTTIGSLDTHHISVVGDDNVDGIQLVGYSKNEIIDQLMQPIITELTDTHVNIGDIGNSNDWNGTGKYTLYLESDNQAPILAKDATIPELKLTIDNINNYKDSHYKLVFKLSIMHHSFTYVDSQIYI